MSLPRSSTPRGPGSRSKARGKHAGQVRISLGERPLNFEWAATISGEEWATYHAAVDVVRAAGIPFMLGGGFALAAFTGRWRDTKDIDFYINPHDREPVVEALTKAGFADYYARLPYDRKWIYRSTRSDVIVDIIWSMANQRAQVDPVWFQRARPVLLRDLELLVVPKEEFMWCKLYIMQRDHCDWTDLFNLLYAAGRDIDWDHLLWRLGPDVPLLKGLLNVYGWLCPREAADLPEELFVRLGMEPPPAEPDPPPQDRVRLLDSRCWFAAMRKPGEKLEV